MTTLTLQKRHPTALAALSTLLLCAWAVGCTSSELPTPTASATPASIASTATPETSQAVPPTETATVTPAPTEDVGPTETAAPEDTEPPPFVLTSSAFEDGETIPTVYTCDGQDTSPALSWVNPPEATASFALVVDDPDAPSGTWVHWVVYNIPASARSLSEDVPVGTSLSDGTRQGQNSWPKLGYGGPCPPNGTHRYFFTLYALDVVLDLAPDATDKAALLTAMEGHVLNQATLMGLYER